MPFRFLLSLHVMGTRVAELAHDVSTSYASILLTFWYSAPWIGVLQTVALIVVWAHGCIGVHFWLRNKRWYRDWVVAFRAFAILLPTLALAGFVAAGNQTLREAASDPDYVPDRPAKHQGDAGGRGAGVRRRQDRAAHSHRAGRLRVRRARAARLAVPPPRAADPHARQRAAHDHPAGRHGAGDAARQRRAARRGVRRPRPLHDLPRDGHAGPRPAAGAAGREEAAALARIKASPGTRLACQIRPTESIAIMPLFAADAAAADGTVRGGLEGSERLITVVFVDLRGSTTIGEAKLPYDVLYLLNQFFHEMTRALTATRGHYSQFTGDGLMALYGLYESDPARGAADALRGAHAMLSGLERLNRQLRNEMSQPLKIGIGIHHAKPSSARWARRSRRSSPRSATP